MVGLWEFQKQLKMFLIISDSFISRDTSKVKLRRQELHFFFHSKIPLHHQEPTTQHLFSFALLSTLVKCCKFFVSLCFSYIFGKSSIIQYGQSMKDQYRPTVYHDIPQIQFSDTLINKTHSTFPVYCLCRLGCQNSLSLIP